LDRRAFLKVAGSGIVVAFSVDDLPGFDAEQGGQRSYPDDFNGCLSHPSG